jgi:NhaA family Na+:H+ antiporter
MRDSRYSEIIEQIVEPLQAFTRHKLAGAITLLGAALAAVLWANSPWADLYQKWLHLEVSLRIGGLAVEKSLHHWISDGLMGVFFFVVGLEIKREVLAGELSRPRKAALPVAAALGGMLVPALIYFLFNPSGPAASGWGIPMATDIAFALGVLALLGDRVPVSLKVFLTALAIVDDIGAVLVIAVFYTDSIQFGSLGIGAALFLVSVGANLAGVRYSVFYFVVGALVWLAFLKSGVHATLAAVLMAMTIPARTHTEATPFGERMEKCLSGWKAVGGPDARGLLTGDQVHVLFGMGDLLDRATPPLQRLEHSLMPMVTFFVLPVFALANAGLGLSANLLPAFADPIGLGTFLGLFLGKQVGIFAFAWLAVKARWADLPAGTGWRQVHAVSVLGGIGFTMSLFIGGLAFEDPSRLETAKLGILLASVLSGLLAWALLRMQPAR